MNVGLLLTPVSVYQMVRGALVLWVGLFSVIFLNRRLSVSQWASLSLVMLGVVIVGLSNSLFKSAPSAVEAESISPEASRAAMGVSLILFAQILYVFHLGDRLEFGLIERRTVRPLNS